MDNYACIAANVAIRKAEKVIEEFAENGKKRTYDNRITGEEIKSALFDAVAGMGVDIDCSATDDYDTPGYLCIILYIECGEGDTSALELIQTYIKYSSAQDADETKVDAAVEKVRKAFTSINNGDDVYTDKLFAPLEDAKNSLISAKIYGEYDADRYTYTDLSGRYDLDTAFWAGGLGSNDWNWNFMFTKIINPGSEITLTENSSKIATAKNAVNMTLAKFVVTANTSEADVQTAVNAAISSLNVTGVSGKASLILDKTRGTAAITVNLSAGNDSDTLTLNGYTFEKQSIVPTTPGGTATTEPDNTTPTTTDNTTPAENTDLKKAQSAANAFKETWVYKSPGTQDWITAEDIENGTHNQTVFAGTWLDGVDLGGAAVTVKSEMLDKSKGTAKLTYTFTVGSEKVSVETVLTVKAEGSSSDNDDNNNNDNNNQPPAPTYYAVGFAGDYSGSGITVSSTRNIAGTAVTVKVPVGYTVDVVSGNNRIATISDGTGTFTMPAGNVTLNVSSYIGMLSSGYKNSYIYSYDSSMNHITTNSVR
ncbi:MAG: hypothetical protein NC078_11670, partial [Ruminococcus sp.]|nr:hypothetical protein [Ruminococcus sp.]